MKIDLGSHFARLNRKTAPTTVLAFLLLILIGSFVFYWGMQAYSSVFNDAEGNFLEGSLAAFAGAFFAFIFLRLAEVLNAIAARQKKHYDALVYYETQVWQVGSSLLDNLYSLTGMRNALNLGMVNFVSLAVVPFDTDRITEIYNLHLINRLFQFSHRVRRVREDQANLEKGYDEMRLAFLQKFLDHPQYVQNGKVIIDGMIYPLLGEIEDLREEGIAISAEIQLLCESDMPLLTRFIRFFNPPSVVGPDLESVKRKVEIINKEMDAGYKESVKRIERIKAKVEQKRVPS